MAVKTMKKTVKAAKKRPPAPKRARMTLEEFIAATEVYRRDAEARDAKYRAEAEARRMEAEARDAKYREEAEARQAEAEARLCRLEASVEKMAERVDKVVKRVDTLSQNIGGVNNRLGELMEIIIVPNLRRTVNSLDGHSFVDIIPDKTVRGMVGGRREAIAQVDLFLFGGNEAMAVEVKTHLRQSDVDWHLKRLRKLREYEEEAGVKDKKLFGASVGAVIDDDAREFAKKNGVYIIRILEDEDKLEIEPPETCKVW